MRDWLGVSKKMNTLHDRTNWFVLKKICGKTIQLRINDVHVCSCGTWLRHACIVDFVKYLFFQPNIDWVNYPLIWQPNKILLIYSTCKNDRHIFFESTNLPTFDWRNLHAQNVHSWTSGVCEWLFCWLNGRRKSRKSCFGISDPVCMLPLYRYSFSVPIDYLKTDVLESQFNEVMASFLAEIDGLIVCGVSKNNLGINRYAHILVAPNIHMYITIHIYAHWSIHFTVRSVWWSVAAIDVNMDFLKQSISLKFHKSFTFFNFGRSVSTAPLIFENVCLPHACILGCFPATTIA